MPSIIGDGYTAGGRAFFFGGPFAGKDMPVELVPWGLFLPRSHGQATDGWTGEIRNHLTPDYIKQHDHYELTGMIGHNKYYEFREGQDG